MRAEANAEGVVLTTNFMQINNMVEGATGEPTGWNVHDVTCSVKSNTLEAGRVSSSQ